MPVLAIQNTVRLRALPRVNFSDYFPDADGSHSSTSVVELVVAIVNSEAGIICNCTCTKPAVKCILLLAGALTVDSIGCVVHPLRLHFLISDLDLFTGLGSYHFKSLV